MSRLNRWSRYDGRAKMKPVVTIYIPCYNYGRFLPQAVESVLAQTLPDWELIIVDDGSADETAVVAAKYQAADPARIRVVAQTPARGLQFSANVALREAKGEYVMRLDADDFLDENALLILVSYLTQHPQVALVYPNYIYVDEEGNYLGIEQRKRIGQEAQLLDLPPHGAGTMIRKRVLKSVGGYGEAYVTQDGYELWLKILNRYGVGHVSTPLFFYRQHPVSLSRDEGRVLEARRQIKRDTAVAHQRGDVAPRIVAIVPVKNTYARLPDIALRAVAGKPLLDHTIDAALQVQDVEKIVVTTDDPRVIEHCQGQPKVLAMLRPKELSDEQVWDRQVVSDVVQRLESEHGLYADIIVVLSVHAPLRRAKHIQEAIDTLQLYNSDGVVSVYEDYDLHYTHGRSGLIPLNPAMHRHIRREREALYVNNGAVRVLWRDVLKGPDLSGCTLGHIVMLREESVQIKSLADLAFVEQWLARRDSREAAPVSSEPMKVPG